MLLAVGDFKLDPRITGFGYCCFDLIQKDKTVLLTKDILALHYKSTVAVAVKNLEIEEGIEEICAEALEIPCEELCLPSTLIKIKPHSNGEINIIADKITSLSNKFKTNDSSTILYNSDTNTLVYYRNALDIPSNIINISCPLIVATEGPANIFEKFVKDKKFIIEDNFKKINSLLYSFCYDYTYYFNSVNKCPFNTICIGKSLKKLPKIDNFILGHIEKF